MKTILIISLLVGVIFVSGCSESDFIKMVCSDTSQDAWYVKFWCKLQKDDEKVCPSSRMEKVSGECKCPVEYPIMKGDSCLTVSEYQDEGGSMTNCLSSTSTEGGKFDCIKAYAKTQADCDKVDYDQKESCAMVITPLYQQCKNAAIVDQCMAQNAKTMVDCKYVMDDRYVGDCAKKVSSNFFDCTQLLSEVQKDKCMVALAKKTDDCLYIRNLLDKRECENKFIIVGE